MKVIEKEIPAEFREDVRKAVVIFREVGCEGVYLFGSLARGESTRSSDIDFAVTGLPTSQYFRVVGSLLSELDHPCDLVELDHPDNRFSKFILDNEDFIRVA